MNSRHAQRGQALPLVAISMVALLGIGALSVDVGNSLHRQRMQQIATDAAAMAGAQELEYSTAYSDVQTAAQNDATTDGFTAGTGTSVTVNYPPADGNLAGSTSAVQVVISTTQPTFFAGVLGQNSSTVVTKATASLSSNGAAPCVYQLDPNGTFTADSGTIYAPTCGIITNGAATYNNGTITVSSDGYAGTISTNTTVWPQASPQPSIPATDPCAQITGCAYLTDHPPATTPCTYTNLKENQDVTLSPGVYCGGLTVNASNIAFNPGLYVFTGDVTVNGNSTITGTGVTFDMVSGAITLNGNSATTTLSAPTTGSYANCLIYQPKANTSGPTLNSGHAGSLIGALYFPGALITGNSAGDQWTLIIGASMKLNGANLKGPNGKGMTGGVQNVLLAE